MSNPYYDPAVHGLTSVGSIEWDYYDWEFHITAVWKGPNRRLYWATDSGCSCPTPFENIRGLSDLEQGNKTELRKYLNARLSSANDRTRAVVEMNELLSKI
jgi:hypothetical protein